MVSPGIGLAPGLATVRAAFLRPWQRVLLALVVLYATAALFGLGVGAFDAFVIVGEHRDPARVLVLAVLCGLTFPGWILLVWPLAYATLAVLARESPWTPRPDDPGA